MNKTFVTLALLASFALPMVSLAATETSAPDGNGKTPTHKVTKHTHTTKKIKKSHTVSDTTVSDTNATSTDSMTDTHKKSKFSNLMNEVKNVMGTTTTTTAAPTPTQTGVATAVCKDGTDSYSKSHSGSCADHGGVSKWLDGTAN